MTCYSNFFEKSGEFVKLCNGVSSQNGACGAIGIIDEAKPFVIHSLCEKLNKTAFVLTGDEASAIKIYENLSKIEKGVLLYPRREFNFLDVEGASREYEQLRLGVLSNIISENYKIVVASLGAAMQFTMPPNELKAKSFEIKTGDDIDLDEISKRLVKAGYTRFDQVDATSQFACRGGIIDIYSPGSDAPVRIELWGNTVDSITKFDIATQRRTNKVDTISIIPSCEVLFNSKEEQIKKIENLALSLKGKATKAREKLLSDVDKLNQNLTIRANDKYLPLAYNSNGLFDYIGDDLLFVCESAKAKDRCNAQNKLLFEDIKWLLKDGNICAGLD